MRHGYAQLFGLALLLIYIYCWWVMDSRKYDKALENQANIERFESRDSQLKRGISHYPSMDTSYIDVDDDNFKVKI